MLNPFVMTVGHSAPAVVMSTVGPGSIKRCALSTGYGRNGPRMVSGYVVVRGGGLLRAQRRRLAGDPLAYHLAAQSRLPPHLGTQPLPPGDALNALTIGATHSDGLGDIDVPDTAWDITHQNAPAHYSATGPGVDRSVKPDLHHVGGRALYALSLIHI